MALSDVIYESALDIEDGIRDYQDDGPDYPLGDVLELVDFLKRYAGLIQDGDVIPKLPTIVKDTFVGPQRRPVRNDTSELSPADYTVTPIPGGQPPTL